MDRKQFLRKLGRISILVGMASIVAMFVGRNQVSGKAECGVKGGCGSCAKAGSCGLEEKGS